MYHDVWTSQIQNTGKSLSQYKGSTRITGVNESSVRIGTSGTSQGPQTFRDFILYLRTLAPGFQNISGFLYYKGKTTESAHGKLRCLSTQLCTLVGELLISHEEMLPKSQEEDSCREGRVNPL